MKPKKSFIFYLLVKKYKQFFIKPKKNLVFFTISPQELNFFWQKFNKIIDFKCILNSFKRKRLKFFNMLFNVIIFKNYIFIKNCIFLILS